MKLKDIERPTELIRKAMGDGVQTVEQYEDWLMGYISGSNDVMNDIKRDTHPAHWNTREESPLGSNPFMEG